MSHEHRAGDRGRRQGWHGRDQYEASAAASTASKTSSRSPATGAAKAGVVVAIAAGNSGPGVNTVESPGQAADAINGLRLDEQSLLRDPGHRSQRRRLPLPSAPSAASTRPLPRRWRNWTDSSGAKQGLRRRDGHAFAGSIVVIDRGTCTFSTKIRNAQSAGGGGRGGGEQRGGRPDRDGAGCTANQPTISGVMVRTGRPHRDSRGRGAERDCERRDGPLRF